MILLLLCLALRVSYDSAGRKLSVEVGGAKRLQTITTLGEAALLLPLALLSCFLQVGPTAGNRTRDVGTVGTGCLVDARFRWLFDVIGVVRVDVARGYNGVCLKRQR